MLKVNTSEGNSAQRRSHMKMALRYMKCRRLFCTHWVSIASIYVHQKIPNMSPYLSHSTHTALQTSRCIEIIHICEFLYRSYLERERVFSFQFSISKPQRQDEGFVFLRVNWEFWIQVWHV